MMSIVWTFKKSGENIVKLDMALTTILALPLMKTSNWAGQAVMLSLPYEYFSQTCALDLRWWSFY